MNRPSSNKNFILDNIDLTKKICDIIIKINLKNISICILDTVLKNTYMVNLKKCGNSTRFKKKNNSRILIMSCLIFLENGANLTIIVLSVHFVKEIKVKLFSSNSKIKLLYIDDLIDFLLNFKLLKNSKTNIVNKFKFTYESTAQQLCKIIQGFEKIKQIIYSDFQTRFIKNLYSTYISLLPKKIYISVKSSKDLRGNFIETFKSENSGQISIICKKK